MVYSSFVNPFVTGALFLPGCSRAFLARGLTETDFDRYSPTALSAYHRSAGGSGSEGDLGNGIILKQHYRSVPVIARFNARLCYPDMIIKTSPSPSLLGANLIACHVEGNQADRVNQAEIDAVEALIEELLEAGYCSNSPDNSHTIPAFLTNIFNRGYNPCMVKCKQGKGFDSV